MKSTFRSSLLTVSRRATLLTAALVTSLIWVGCSGEKSAAGSPAVTAAAALPVHVHVVAPQAVTLTRELPGRVSASRVAQVRARISGIVQKRLFTEGTQVEAGQVLFEIDPAPYQAAFDSAQANLARAEAGLASAKLQADRFSGLVATNAVSQQNYDDAVALHLTRQAEVAAAKAALSSAEINLGYTRVTAPISGRIGRAEVTEGAYVQQATATLLAVVQQLDPLYVDLTQSADDVLNLQAALAAGELKPTGDGELSFQIVLGNGKTHAATGSLQFSDVTVDPTTGTVGLRGTIPNPDATLLPGMYVRAVLDEGIAPAAILVPQSLVSRNAQGQATTLVVSGENTVEPRVLTTARTVGNQWLVTAGLTPGDRIITDQLQKIRPGMPVQPQAAATASTEG
ncbi:efflux RND transporter periplasmic adaptor subunit [Synoicihabitans lomoniglobus]|uniref:Efflux RND transporter periplasmic adaptor subunit n=1 Tax=Synoicihabitans lomoniglobus TaxID=2909285 RepID=A0AAE9ZV16_9BACT|nr:efflux RND transporter periplasmic adaptor subunit [Opitutaceae bacterium LMO-M01]WED63310.1 efflux RND transporter periplasmic adaptor subunit [Opitutaceae bacterium LMO-M01]